MSALQSLRSRLILGAILWTLGLFAVAGVVLTQLIYAYPQAPRMFHWPFTHGLFVTTLAAVLLIGGFVQVRRGLSPIAQLRDRLSGIHDGRASRLEGTFPSEVQPLVNDLNTLLASHEAAITRAQSKAGDLAHGLKTPLAVLSTDARSAGVDGHTELSESIQRQVDQMRRRIDYHLAHARAAASAAMPHVRCRVSESVDGLVRTVQRIYADRGLTIDAQIPATVFVRVQREDLDELMGNLLDNACKWARSRIVVSLTVDAALVSIVVDDDGAGVPDDRRADVLRRGVRADQTAPGSGFGLAIVRDLADLYGGTISLTTAPQGGTRATLTLPSASAT